MFKAAKEFVRLFLCALFLSWRRAGLELVREAKWTRIRQVDLLSDAF
jgi:hypothetical protein